MFVEWCVSAAIVALRNQAYRFTKLKSKPDETTGALERVVFTVAPADEKVAKAAVKKATALANGMELTRNLANLPPNVCTPSYLADIAKKMAKEWNLKVDVLRMKQFPALNMGAFLAVARASTEEPKFIVLK